jgi:hypothetical protein
MQDPEDAVEDTTIVYPRHAARLVRQHRLDGSPFMGAQFVAHDSRLSVGGMNHGSAVGLNSQDISVAVTPKSGRVMLTLSFVGRDP